MPPPVQKCSRTSYVIESHCWKFLTAQSEYTYQSIGLLGYFSLAIRYGSMQQNANSHIKPGAAASLLDIRKRMELVSEQMPCRLSLSHGACAEAKLAGSFSSSLHAPVAFTSQAGACPTGLKLHYMGSRWITQCLTASGKCPTI